MEGNHLRQVQYPARRQTPCSQGKEGPPSTYINKYDISIQRYKLCHGLGTMLYCMNAPTHHWTRVTFRLWSQPGNGRTHKNTNGQRSPGCTLWMQKPSDIGSNSTDNCQKQSISHTKARQQKNVKRRYSSLLTRIIRRLKLHHRLDSIKITGLPRRQANFRYSRANITRSPIQPVIFHLVSAFLSS